MARLVNFHSIYSRTYDPTAAINAGQPVTPAGGLAGAGVAIQGIAMETVDSTDAAESGFVSTVLVMGECELTAGAAIAIGAAIEVGTSGKFITLASGRQIGIALEAAAGDGSTFKALIMPQ